ncbi:MULTISPECIES: HPP family protein [Paenarthrobacter]|uniref:HPP family protein n=1 Tax=Paenarthrobacter TaxID=1742992 RepID=UPI0021B1BD05|nr:MULTISPECIES: HPP family protein [Paenarthrobacter]MDD7833944.1 HPP family protein [Paenarthrobacter sp. AB444]
MNKSAGQLGAGTYACVLGAATLAAAGLVGLLSHLPWLFPSLGPTVMLFFESPQQKAASPGNTLAGHGVGLLAGAGCLYALGLQDIPPAPTGGLTPGHVVAGIASVGLTSLILALIKKPHPPAGATTLIVSLGILKTPAQLLTMAGAILLVTALGWTLNLILGTRPSSS